MAEKFLEYKGKPLVRQGNTIYYGSMADDYIIMLQIKSQKPLGDIELADKVAVQLISTNPNLTPKESIIKTTEKKGLYAAMDIAEVWLSRALAQNE
ncbi:MAG: hypothetical protein E7515_08200 [Ruminococcaceae bacterium]|nr:hypothetical protein [Oscillospiraceae bacterium]